MKGLDCGTSFIVLSSENKDGNIVYKDFRDAFYVIKPRTPIASKMIEKGLKGKTFVKDNNDGSFIVLGSDAIEKAIERNESANRPMYRGVISPKEKDARKILSYILKEVTGKASKKNEKLVFCIPAQPIDQEDEEFDIGYHEDVVTKIFTEQGYDARAINEAEALCYSELEDNDYTGIAISCLIPKTKIYTRKGIVNIEDVAIGDEVITHKGRWKKVTNVITKEFSGVSTKFQIRGYSNKYKDYGFVDNHELFVNRNNKWQWTGCEEVVVGDIIGEPIIKQDRFGKSRISISLYEKKTNSKNRTKSSVSVTGDVQRLIGYFLGDGSVNVGEGCIQFDFGINEEKNINDVQEILLKNFHKQSAQTIKGNNCIRVKCYSKPIVNWFKNNLYDNYGNKKYPWSLSKLTKANCLNLLSGLIRSDGWVKDIGFSFSNTNTHLVWLTKQLCARVGLITSVQYREPRTGGTIGERQIVGKKREWTINVSEKHSSCSVKEFINNVNCSSSKFAEKMFIDNNFMCSRISKIKHDNYNGTVYDLQVEDDHSFSGPFLTIHNCGAGMTNVCVMSSGEPVLTFSTTVSGDWVDRMSAVATGETDSVVQAEKEGGDFTVGQPNDNQVLSAVASYYVRLIDYTVKQIGANLAGHKSLPKFSNPLPVVVAGGTSKAKGYIETFTSKLEEHNFPLEVSEVRHAADPLHAVAKGCLIAAQVF